MLIIFSLFLNFLFCTYNYIPLLRQRFDKRTKKKYSSWHFTTRSLPCFTEFYHLFYINGKKFIPHCIGELLTPRALAFWIMDDGTAIKSGLILQTDSYSISEVERLADTVAVILI
jgi:LAGLIDADG DNA endonuclease family